MGLFDIFKKKKIKSKQKKTDLDELIKSGKIKVPKEKLNCMEVTSEEITQFSNDRRDNQKLIDSLPKNDFPSLGGKIVGYNPQPKNFLSNFYAVVEYPIIGEPQRNYVVNCTALIKIKSANTITYPSEGTWIMFKDLGDNKEADGINRSYGVATLVFDQKLFDMMMTLVNKSK